MNRKFSLRYVLIALAFFCFSGVGRVWQSDAANNNYYSPSNTNVSLYRSQCANAPVLATYDDSDQRPCYQYRTSIQIYWSNGHSSKYSVRQSPAGYIAYVEEETGVYQEALLDLSRKDIKPEKGTGLAEIWRDNMTRIALNGQVIKTYENPEMSFAKDAHNGPNFALWFWGGLGIVCVVVLLATEGARYLGSGVRYR